MRSAPAPILDYRTPRPAEPRSLTSIGLLLAPPAVGFLVTVAAVLHNMVEEPFGQYSVHEAMLQVGQAVVAALAWIAWCVIAWHERIGRAWAIPTLACAGLHLWLATGLAVGYFSEPWNW